ncbi:hypothetical protein BJF83_04285 [Nocardiopsis sp. CNR-923]|uniref:hypothetical protein n=1 Tax=Nocardiopsis sp. CNR-923 TaxID=1904965 RepID=UPI000961B436|nr:hypothetical protein [Nocardiopsis sp. CNR-923]OLT26088.1 hypothetical protein BJF83_04285 [Nocardiopsis sp. CNR-923]
MGDLSSMVPAGLVDVLSALIPPVVVATVFCAFVIKLLRREMAPRRMDGSLVSGDSAESAGADASAASVTGAADDASITRSGERAESDGR